MRTLNRRHVFEQLRERGLGVNVHYIPVHRQPYYQKLFDFRNGSFPQAEAYYEKVITMPLFPSMSTREVEFSIECIRDIVEGM